MKPEETLPGEKEGVATSTSMLQLVATHSA